MSSNSLTNSGALKSSNNYFQSNGKLLIAGEYLVLEGATALALPINKSQSLEIYKTDSSNVLNWIAKHKNGNWFNAQLALSNFEIISADNIPLANRLAGILKKTRGLNPEFLKSGNGIQVKTNLDFLPWHGLGSSSTLINNIAKWAGVDAYELQKTTFKGSGYDIACAQSEKPLFFKLVDGKPIVEETEFKPGFSNNVYFVYLEKKQRSLESIKDFRANAKYSSNEISEISEISRSIVRCEKLEEFEFLIEHHEKILSRVLGRPTIKSVAFSDFDGSVKSLGGWGGDFVMMTSKMSKTDFANYLLAKKLPTFYSFNDLLII